MNYLVDIVGVRGIDLNGMRRKLGILLKRSSKVLTDELGTEAPFWVFPKGTLARVFRPMRRRTYLSVKH